MAWIRTPRWLKSCLMAAGRGLDRKPDTGGLPERPCRAAGLPRLLVNACEGEGCLPSLEAAEGRQVGSIF